MVESTQIGIGKSQINENRTITYQLSQTLSKEELKNVSGAMGTSIATGGGGSGGGSIDVIIDI